MYTYQTMLANIQSYLIANKNNPEFTAFELIAALAVALNMDKDQVMQDYFDHIQS